MHKLLKIVSKETVWLILDELSHKNQTPTDIAKKLEMSGANIDKFLELLEEVGIVKKVRKIKKGPGRPFTEYGLGNGPIFIVDFSNGKKCVLQNNEELSKEINVIIKKYKGEQI